MELFGFWKVQRVSRKGGKCELYFFQFFQRVGFIIKDMERSLVTFFQPWHILEKRYANA